MDLLAAATDTWVSGMFKRFCRSIGRCCTVMHPPQGHFWSTRRIGRLTTNHDQIGGWNCISRLHTTSMIDPWRYGVMNALSRTWPGFRTAPRIVSNNKCKETRNVLPTAFCFLIFFVPTKCSHVPLSCIPCLASFCAAPLPAKRNSPMLRRRRAIGKWW